MTGKTLDKIATLRTLGFTEDIPGWWDWRVPGSFGFTVRVVLADWDGNPIQPEFTVSLPHQCDSWAVVEAETDPTASLELMRSFTRESRRAYDMLARIGGLAHEPL